MEYFKFFIIVFFGMQIVILPIFSLLAIFILHENDKENISSEESYKEIFYCWFFITFAISLILTIIMSH